MKKLLIALVAAAFVSSAAMADEKIRIGTEGAYPPFNQKDASGNLVGFDIDIAKALCDKMGAECTFVAQDWDGIIPALLAKKYDAIVASMSITEERKKAVAFTDRYYSNSLRYLAKKGAGVNPCGLSGKSIGAQRATISASYLEDNVKDVSIKLYDTQENAYLDLASGRIDVVLADMLPSLDWLNSDAGKGFEFIGENIDIDDKIGIAIRKSDTHLLADFNKALKDIRADGTYDKINAKYFPFSIY